jgi:thioredoxin reductase (NADPH)
MEALPTIDAERCTGCECCVLCCPTQALAMVEGKAVLVHPDRCDFDGRCESVCPVDAVELPYRIVLAQPAEGAP